MLGALADLTCAELHGQIAEAREIIATGEEQLRQWTDELKFLPADEASGSGTVGAELRSDILGLQRSLWQVQRSLDERCAMAATKDCPCETKKDILVVAVVGIVALMGVVWLVRR